MSKLTLAPVTFSPASFNRYSGTLNVPPGATCTAAGVPAIGENVSLTAACAVPVIPRPTMPANTGMIARLPCRLMPISVSTPNAQPLASDILPHDRMPAQY